VQPLRTASGFVRCVPGSRLCHPLTDFLIFRKSRLVEGNIRGQRYAPAKESKTRVNAPAPWAVGKTAAGEQGAECRGRAPRPQPTRTTFFRRLASFRDLP
jgi:hypothetical protein